MRFARNALQRSGTWGHGDMASSQEGSASAAATREVDVELVLKFHGDPASHSVLVVGSVPSVSTLCLHEGPHALHTTTLHSLGVEMSMQLLC